jgi:hydrogenase maturation factor
MCLGAVCRVIDVEPDGTAIVAAGDRLSTVSLLALTGRPAVPGDWVVVHSGLALTVLSPAEAEDAMALRAPAGAGTEGDHQ